VETSTVLAISISVGSFLAPSDRWYSALAPEVRSDGTYVRDYFCVEDAAAALLRLAEELHRSEIVGQAYNFGIEEPTDVLAVVHVLHHIAARLDLQPVIRNKAHAEIKAHYLSCAKACRLLGWRHQTDLMTGLPVTFRWYERFLDRAAVSSFTERAGI